MIKVVLGRCIPFSVLGLLILSLTGCNSKDSDTSPPDHIISPLKSQGKYRFGVSDTLSFSFSEKIDTAALALDFTPPEGIGFRFTNASKLIVFGKNSIYGSGYFNINSPFSVKLSGLKDTHGNGRPLIEESFFPYAWIDRDFVDTNFSGYDSLFATDSTWKDGVPLTDSLVAEAALDYKNNIGREDRQDFKIIKLGAPDTLDIVLTSRKTLNVKLQIAGPYLPADFDKDFPTIDFDSSFYSGQTGTTGRLVTKFNAEYDEHKRKVGGPEKSGLYILRLTIPVDYEGFYRMGLKVRKFK
jgi:hypothetical protein